VLDISNDEEPRKQLTLTLKSAQERGILLASLPTNQPTNQPTKYKTNVMSAEPVSRKSVLMNSKPSTPNLDIEGQQQQFSVSAPNSFHSDGNHDNATLVDHHNDNSNTQSKPTMMEPNVKPGVLSTMGLKVLALLACQNAFKNILMRFVMKDHGGFLLSTAVIVVELLKLFFSTMLHCVLPKTVSMEYCNIYQIGLEKYLLLIVPATSYSLQMSLEYIAMANIDPASFSVLVQMKMLTTAMFFRTILKKRLMKKQFISLVILTVGVMLCSMKTSNDENTEDSVGDKTLGIAATLGKFCR
jgi:Nucleotide-sugar transporter.